MSEIANTKQIIRDGTKNDSRREIEYKVLKVLGEGGFGKVSYVSRTKYDFKQGRDVTFYYALKTIPKSKLNKDRKLRNRVITEIKIHRQLNHPNICKFDHSFDDEENVNIVLEYCQNNSLQDLLDIRKKLTELEVRYYMYQVLQVLIYLKRQKVIHRDLTLSNIFLNENNIVKVGDFGLSFKETNDEEKTGKVCGTEPYLAPEISGIVSFYSYKTDIWAFGVGIYFLLTGLTLFYNSEDAKDKIDHNLVSLSSNISEEAKSLLLQIFVKDHDRIDLLKIQDHPFFNNGIDLDVDMPTYSKNNEKEFFAKIDRLKKSMTITTSIDEFAQIKKVNFNDETIYPFAMISSINTARDREKKSLSKINKLSEFEEATKTKNDINIDNNDSKKVNSLSSRHLSDNKSNQVFQRSNIRINTITDILPKQNDSTIKCNCCFYDSNDIAMKLRPSQFKESSRSLVSQDFSMLNLSSKEYFSQTFEETKESVTNDIFIINYKDESNKYGIGYRLNNGMFGAYFNDKVKIVLNNKELFYYGKDDAYQYYPLPLKYNDRIQNESKNDIYHKYPILFVFIEELLKCSDRYHIDKNLMQNGEIVYLQRWKKTKRALFFLLSNKNIQVNFFDKTLVVFYYKNKIIRYHNEYNEIRQFYADKLSSFHCDDPEIKSKITYSVQEFLKDN